MLCDIAVSRYYYYIYQRIKSYVNKNINPSNEIITKTIRNHNHPIKRFANLVSGGDEKLASQVKKEIQILQGYREIYEYQEYLLTKEDFDIFYKNLKVFQINYKIELEL